MKIRIVAALALFSITACTGDKKAGIENRLLMPDVEMLNEVLEEATERYRLMAEEFDTLGVIPHTEKEGEILGVDPSGWVSGFFPGTLWYLYELTGDEYWKLKADRFTRKLQEQQYNSGTHDLGFIMYCSYGNGFRLTGDPGYIDELMTSAQTLSTRYNPEVGSILSWDFPGWWEQFPVIIDNMMNLELLMWASKQSGNGRFTEIASSHSRNTLRDHYRHDYSCYHVVDYDTSSGKPLKKGTFQGAFDESIWSRGQAWGLYGFTMMYRETGDTAFLNHASKTADFLLSMTDDDPVPAWDLSLKDKPGTEKDASSAAILSSALAELYELTGKERYFNGAIRIIRALCEPPYFDPDDENGGFLLNHCVVHKPANHGINVPLSYADYYFIEALLRLKSLS